MSLSRFLDPKNDYAFQQIFGLEKNKDILISFLNEVLQLSQDERVTEVTFLKTKQDREIAAYRTSILDVLCKDQCGTQFIVEMQVDWHAGFEKRAQYYAAKAYSRQRLEEDEHHKKMAVYEKLQGVIFIAISDFILFPEKKEWLSRHRILDDKTYENDLRDFYFLFIELPKFKKHLDELANICERWAYFFKHAQQTSLSDMEKLIEGNTALKRAFQVIDQATWTEDQLLEYEDIQKEILDAAMIEDTKLANAEQRGRKEGRQEEKIETAKKMLADGVPLEVMRKYTGLNDLDFTKNLS